MTDLLRFIDRHWFGFHLSVGLAAGTFLYAWMNPNSAIVMFTIFIVTLIVGALILDLIFERLGVQLGLLDEPNYEILCLGTVAGILAGKILSLLSAVVMAYKF